MLEASERVAQIPSGTNGNRSAGPSSAHPPMPFGEVGGPSGLLRGRRFGGRPAATLTRLVSLRGATFRRSAGKSGARGAMLRRLERDCRSPRGVRVHHRAARQVRRPAGVRCRRRRASRRSNAWAATAKGSGTSRQRRVCRRIVEPPAGPAAQRARVGGERGGRGRLAER